MRQWIRSKIETSIDEENGERATCAEIYLNPSVFFRLHC